MDRWTMVWQLTLVTKYNEDYLMAMAEEDLKKLYIEKVEKNGQNRQ